VVWSTSACRREGQGKEEEEEEEEKEEEEEAIISNTTSSHNQAAFLKTPKDPLYPLDGCAIVAHPPGKCSITC
jgi:hypothetical protein